MPMKFNLVTLLTIISRLSWAWKMGFDGACQTHPASSKNTKTKMLKK